MDIRKQVLLLIFSFLSIFAMAQKATVVGAVIDKKSGETLIGATVMLQGTTSGAMADFEGNYTFTADPGVYNVICSFVSYETQKIPNVEIKADETYTFNFSMVDAAVEIGGVEVVAKRDQSSESMMLIEQRKASGIKESIGASRLSQLGVSDAATATAKISGVVKSEGSGDVYIRGLGDRYLSTSMNGLPIPSDDVEKKNIDLNLFSTDVIQNVGINKTYTVENSADQASGNVDIASKTEDDGWSIGLSLNSNSNVIANGFSNFRSSQNMNDIAFGFYKSPYNTVDAVNRQSWEPIRRKFPLAYDFSVSYGHHWDFGQERKLLLFTTLNHGSSSNYQKGTFKAYRSNVLNNSFDDVETYNTNINTTGLLSLEYNFNNDNSIHFNSMTILKTTDELYESGRDGNGYMYDMDIQPWTGAFVRDQNTKETQMFINQLIGKHKMNDKNNLDWALGYNVVNADEPNRIRNEMMQKDGIAYFYNVSDYQQRKSSQSIVDSEFNGYVKNVHQFVDTDKKVLKLNTGANFRMKHRDFNSQFVGIRAKGLSVPSIDDVDDAFLNQDVTVREQTPDTYNGDLLVLAAYTSLDFARNKFSGNVGLRYEYDQINVNWNVNNYVGREGETNNIYNNLLPSLNLKYQINDKHTLRFVTSKTTTLPEFKELAPFEYVSPTGRVTKGNPDLLNSQDYNFDLKWEFFPTRSNLFSATAFYKMIKDPINMAQTRGSSGYFYYANTGKQANIYGLEAEARFAIIKAKDLGQPKLDMTLNATKMWFNQDLFEEFQYNNKTTTDLQGAAGFIFNGAMTFSTNTENPFTATVAANYSGDKVFALGAPEDQENRNTFFNNEIIEKGFATLDLVLTKKLSDMWSLKLSAKNLLNPTIKQTQDIVPINGESPYNDVVSSYKRGVDIKLGVSLNF
ncbi:MAG: TonB-dependent receptor domain-containing protein [Mangrovibacterium sp.]